MTTVKQANELAIAILGRVRRDMGARFDDLDDLDQKHFHRMLSRKLRRTFNELERLLCDELPTQLEGKSQAKMTDILGRAFDSLMDFEEDLAELEFL